MKKSALLLVAASFFLLPGAFAESAPVKQQVNEAPPDAQVKQVTEEVLDILRKDEGIKSGDAKRATELVEQKILPHFDFTRMTSLAVGRDWRQATPDQQKTLTKEFRDLLVRTYSKALTSFKNETVDYRPFKMQPGETDVVVRTQINQPGARQPIKLDYSLEKVASGWMVYDITVADVSLVTNYRSSFATEIRNGGIDGLIKSLKAKNSSTQ